MNIYGILTAAGLYPAYKKAKEKAENAYTALLNYRSWLRSLDRTPKNETQEYQDQNSELDGVTCNVVLRVGNLVGKFFSADGYLILTNTTADRNYVITHIAVSYTLIGQKVTTYFPVGVTSGVELKAGAQVQVPLSGNTGLMIFASGDLRDEFRKKIVDAYNTAADKSWSLITSIPRNTDVDGMATANVEFYYNGATYNSGTPTRAIYRGVATTVRYMGEAFTPNNKNDFDATAGKQN